MTSKESRNDSSRVISFSEESLREWFAQYDEDGSGINHSGFEKLCEQLGIEPHQVPILMTELDGDQDGKITFDDVFSKFGTHFMEQTDGPVGVAGTSESVSSPTSPDMHDTQQFFTPEARINPPTQLTTSKKEKPVQSTPLRSSLIYNRKRFGRWSFSSSAIAPQLKSPQGSSFGDSEDIQFLSPIATSPHGSRPNSSQDNYPDLTSMMSPFVEPNSPRYGGRRTSLVSSDDDSLWEDPRPHHGTAVTGDSTKLPMEAWSERQRSKSVGSPPVMSTPRQGLLTVSQFVPLDGLKQLLSPKNKDEASFLVPLGDVLEELDTAGILDMRGEGGKDFQTILKEMNMLTDGMVNLRTLLSTMDQYMSADAGETPAYTIMKQIALKAYKNEIHLLRKQVGELNIERETLRLSVSRMVEDKDKMATEVDLHHNELHEQTRHLLMKKEKKHEERMRDLERSYQDEIESIHQNHRSKVTHLEQEREKWVSEEEKMKDEIKLGKMEVDALQLELDKVHHTLQEKESQVEALLRMNSEHLDMIQLATENENLKAKLKELGKGEKLEELAQLEEQCKDLKDRIDELTSALETAQSDSKKYRRKTHILRQRETRLKEENQRLRDARGEGEDTEAGEKSRSSSGTVRPSLASTISLDLPYDDDDVELDDGEDELEDDEGVERTEDALSDVEERSLRGEMHDLELKKAKRSIAKLSNANLKLTRDLEVLHSEYQQEQDRCEVLQTELESVSQQCSQLISNLSTMKEERDEMYRQIDKVKGELEMAKSSHATQLQKAEKEAEHYKLLLDSQVGTISSLEEEITSIESEKSSLLTSLDILREENQLAVRYQEQVETLQAELREEQDAHLEEVDNLKKELESVRLKNAQLTEDCSVLQDRISDQNEKLLKSEATFKEMTGEIQKWMTENQKSVHHSREEDLKKFEDLQRHLQETTEELEQERDAHTHTKQTLEEEKEELDEKLLQSEEKCRNLEELCANHKLEAETFAEEVSELKNQLEFLTQRKTEAADQYKAEIDRYKAMLDAASILQKENDGLHLEVEALKQQLEDNRKSLEESDEVRDKEVRSLQDEQESLMDRLLRAENEHEELKRKLTQLQEEKETLCTEKDDEIQCLKEQVEQLQTQMDEEEDELNASQKEKLQLESSLSSLEANFEKQKAAFEVERSAKEEEFSILTSKLNEFEIEMETQRKEWTSNMEELEAQLSAAHSEKYQAEKDILTLRTKLESVEIQLHTDTQKIQEEHSEEMKTQKDKFDQERSSLEEQLKKTSHKLEELVRKIREVEANLSEEKTRYESLVSANSTTLSEQEKVFADKMAAIQHEVQILSVTVSEQKQQISHQEECIAAERQKLTEMETEWKEKEAKHLSTISSIQETLNNTEKQQEEDLESFKLSILRLEKQLTRKESEVEELQKIKEGYDSKLKTAQENLRKATEELMTSGNDAKMAAAAIERVWVERAEKWDSERKELHSRLTTAEGEVSVLNQQLSMSVPASKVAQCEEKIAELLDKLKEKDSALTSKEASITSLRTEMSEKEDEYHKMMDALEVQVSKMAVEVKQQGSYVVSLREELAVEKVTSAGLQEELKFMKTLVEEMERDTDTQEELEALKTNMAQRENELREDIRKKQSMIHTLELSVEAKEDIITEKQREIAHLLAQVESLESELEPDLPGLEDSPKVAVSVGVDTLSRELERERKLSKELHRKVNDLESSFSENLERERRLSNSIVAELESELVVLREKEDSSTTLVRDLRQKLAHSEATIGELSNDLDSFKSTLEERDGGYEERVQNYRRRMTELEEYIEELKSQNQAISKQFEELVEYNEILEDDNHMLRKELEKLESAKKVTFEEMQVYADEKERQIAQLKERLAAAEFSLAEVDLCNPTTVRELEEELRQQKALLAQKQDKVKQLTQQVENEDVPYIIDGEEFVDAGFVTLAEHEQKMESMEKTYKRSMDSLQEEVVTLKEELQSLHHLLKTKSLSLDDSLDQKAQLRQQLREMNEDRELLSKEFKKEHEKDMMELSDKHSREIKKLFREKREIEESHKQSNELVTQLLQQTEELNKDKMRLSKTVREGREERENLLNIIENLANRVVL